MESTSVHGASQSFLFLCAQDTHNSDVVRRNQLKKKRQSIILTWAQIFGQGLRKASHCTHLWYTLVSPLFNRTSPPQSLRVAVFMSWCQRSHFLFPLTVQCLAFKIQSYFRLSVVIFEYPFREMPSAFPDLLFT